MNPSAFKTFGWLNESSVRFDSDRIILHAPEKTDFFCPHGTESEEGTLPESLLNAPFYYTEAAGDFVMRVKVEHAFTSMYDSASIMVMKDLDVWAKACFELTDFGTHAVVSVVTNSVSDDANGCDIEGNSVWLQVARTGPSFAFHYSLDGIHFFMMRYFTLPVEETVKVGLLPQCPTGSGGDRIYSGFVLEKKTLKNIRSGK
ncbi:DUF1349 domain-containing protein [Paenibacillus humicus]|uniref:DUF1349 domain-containing protein n=1 Tax=Paenibacillus humicus TaxID=412861 RepID=UPI000FD6D251|nr:DUF1349 domain-containing protein [Paenibacillus humicus]